MNVALFPEPHITHLSRHLATQPTAPHSTSYPLPQTIRSPTPSLLQLASLPPCCPPSCIFPVVYILSSIPALLEAPGLRAAADSSRAVAPIPNQPIPFDANIRHHLALHHRFTPTAYNRLPRRSSPPCHRRREQTITTSPFPSRAACMWGMACWSATGRPTLTLQFPPIPSNTPQYPSSTPQYTPNTPKYTPNMPQCFPASLPNPPISP